MRTGETGTSRTHPGRWRLTIVAAGLTPGILDYLNNLWAFCNKAYSEGRQHAHPPAKTFPPLQPRLSETGALPKEQR